MRLPIPLINELITEIAGAETVKLVDFLRDKVHVSEFKIANVLNISVNQVRNLLYRLDEHNLVSFIRKKDKKKGWYEYYWTVDLVKAKNAIVERKREKIATIRKTLKDEQVKQYYYCPNGCMRVNPEEALELQFKCPECDAIFKQEDVAVRQEKMHMELKKLQTDLQEATTAVEVPPDIEGGLKKKKAQQPKKQRKKKGKKHEKKQKHVSKKRPKQKQRTHERKKFFKKLFAKKKVAHIRR